MISYTAKVDYVFDHGLPREMTESDFVDLAIAALDQAGLDKHDQDYLAAKIRSAFEVTQDARAAKAGAK